MEIKCNKCEKTLDESLFYAQPRNKNGREYSCKCCRQDRNYERRRERRIENGLLIKFPTLANRQLLEEDKKYCPGCKQIKDIYEFSTTKKGTKIASHCLKCNKIKSQEYNSTEYEKLNRKKTYLRDKDKLKNNHLVREFGITYEKYKSILNEQGGVCKICGKTPDNNGKMLAVDHCHKTGENRGLLCSSCNICVGFIEKNNLDVLKILNYVNRIQPNPKMDGKDLSDI